MKLEMLSESCERLSIGEMRALRGGYMDFYALGCYAAELTCRRSAPGPYGEAACRQEFKFCMESRK